MCNRDHRRTLVIHRFWEKTKKPHTLTILERIAFSFLKLFEKFYLFVFRIHRSFRSSNKNLPIKTISIGNISSGGVGKSVLTKFIVENLGKDGAVLLRGYKGSNEKTKNSFVVSNGEKTFCDIDFCGDEAFMFSKSLKVPIVIGKNRFESSLMLDKSKTRYAVLDDAYQNNTFKKDLDVLLLDARQPFENGYCFPAGRLREKDISRADVIVFTHSNKVDQLELDKLKKLSNVPMFFGKHAVSGIFDENLTKIEPKMLRDKKFLAFAGIGSFSSFSSTLQNLGLNVEYKIPYEDHHKYVLNDIRDIKKVYDSGIVNSIITTGKDVWKVKHLLDRTKEKLPAMYWVDVTFYFLDKKQRDDFLSLVKEALK